MPKVTEKFRNEPFDKMLRRFRNQVERAGIIKRFKDLEYYEKPNVARNIANQALKRKKKVNLLKAEKLESLRKRNRSNVR